MTYPAPTLNLTTLTDHHKPFNPGVQAVTNYDFSSGTTGWTSVNSATLTESGGILKVAYNSVNNPGVKQTFMTTGDRYANRGIKIRSDGVVTYTVKLGGFVYWVGTTSTEWKEIDFPLTALGTDVEITTDATSAGYIEIDHIDIPVVSAIALDSVSGNNAVLGDGATPSTMPTKLSDIGYTFDADAEYMRVTDPAINSQSFAISCFLKVAPAGLTTSRVYLSLEDATYPLVRLWGQNTGRINATIGGVFTPGVTPNQAGDVYGVWRHYIACQDGANTFLYINGMLVGTAVAAAVTHNSQDLWIGNRFDQGLRARGDMALIKYVNNDCPTASEVNDLYQEDRRFIGRRFYV